MSCERLDLLDHLLIGGEDRRHLRPNTIGVVDEDVLPAEPAEEEAEFQDDVLACAILKRALAELRANDAVTAQDIFRGRYRESFSAPKALAPDTPLPFRFILPTANHVFQPGHRIMVQVQSSWFPLYDRNPQTFVPNIFFAKPSDYRKATQRIYLSGDTASSIELPVIPLP